jgi:hypothetical protein
MNTRTMLVGLCAAVAAGVSGCGSSAAPPAGSDAGACAIAATFTWGSDGGFGPSQESSTLSPPDGYRHLRRDELADGGTLAQCSPPLPMCGAHDGISIFDFTRDLAHPDVVQALSLQRAPTYGYDSRPADGAVFAFARDDGHGFYVGSACTPGRNQIDGSACVDAPAGVTALVALLRGLDAQQLAAPECAAFQL